MDWTQDRSIWVSGRYTIEPLESDHWMLTRSYGDGSQRQLVRSETGWTGGSLNQMKAMAEGIEAKLRDQQSVRRTIAQLYLLVLAFSVVVAVEGVLAAVAGIATFVAVLLTLSQLLGRLTARLGDDTLSDVTHTHMIGRLRWWPSDTASNNPFCAVPRPQQTRMDL